ncbi:MAG: hypothetical protein PUD68_13915, partial [Clostridiales bacterium]|nr:hypothetical protein [Clostridiales bacterium]
FSWLLPRCYSRSLRRGGRGLTPGVRFGRNQGLGANDLGRVSEADVGLKLCGSKTKSALVGSDLWPTKASV